MLVAQGMAIGMRVLVLVCGCAAFFISATTRSRFSLAILPHMHTRPPCLEHRTSQIGARVVSHGRTCLAVVGDETSTQAERCLFELRKVRVQYNSRTTEYHIIVQYDS